MMRHLIRIGIPLLIFNSAGWTGLCEEIKIPTVQQVSEKALDYARLSPSMVRGWERKARKASLLPRVQFGFDRRLKNDVNLNLADSISVSSSGVNVGPPQQTQIQDANNDVNFEVKAVWYLDQLLFSKDDLDISGEARQMAAERDRVLTEVRQNYFKRERMVKELTLLTRGRGSSFERELKQIELAEATAVLDGLTGGWFSTQLGEGL